VLVAAWLGVLLVLAFLAANPVTVNRTQILQSDAVVVGTPDGPAPSGVWLRVEKTLFGGPLPSRILIEGPSPAGFERNTQLVAPLQRVNDAFIVTPTPPALKGAVLVYPPQPETLDAITKILTTGTDRPYR
jgi:hypothetical protein